MTEFIKNLYSHVSKDLVLKYLHAEAIYTADFFEKSYDYNIEIFVKLADRAGMKMSDLIQGYPADLNDLSSIYTMAWNVGRTHGDIGASRLRDTVLGRCLTLEHLLLLMEYDRPENLSLEMSYAQTCLMELAALYRDARHKKPIYYDAMLDTSIEDLAQEFGSDVVSLNLRNNFVQSPLYKSLPIICTLKKYLTEMCRMEMAKVDPIDFIKSRFPTFSEILKLYYPKKMGEQFETGELCRLRLLEALIQTTRPRTLFNTVEENLSWEQFFQDRRSNKDEVEFQLSLAIGASCKYAPLTYIQIPVEYELGFVGVNEDFTLIEKDFVNLSMQEASTLYGVQVQSCAHFCYNDSSKTVRWIPLSKLPFYIDRFSEEDANTLMQALSIEAHDHYFDSLKFFTTTNNAVYVSQDFGTIYLPHSRKVEAAFTQLLRTIKARDGSLLYLVEPMNTEEFISYHLAECVQMHGPYLEV